jgi:hypothetical protein
LNEPPRTRRGAWTSRARDRCLTWRAFWVGREVAVYNAYERNFCPMGRPNTIHVRGAAMKRHFKASVPVSRRPAIRDEPDTCARAAAYRRAATPPYCHECAEETSINKRTFTFAAPPRDPAAASGFKWPVSLIFFPRECRGSQTRTYSRAARVCGCRRARAAAQLSPRHV